VEKKLSITVNLEKDHSSAAGKTVSSNKIHTNKTISSPAVVEIFLEQIKTSTSKSKNITSKFKKNNRDIPPVPPPYFSRYEKLLIRYTCFKILNLLGM
jgi:hypothetical protein